MSSTNLPTTIKALKVQENGADPKVVDVPFGARNDLADDQVLVKVRAVGLNPTDWKHAIGPWGSAGAISGCDAAGDVVKVGSKVSHLKAGDRVAGFTHGGNSKEVDGAYAEYVVFQVSVTFKIPDGQTYEEASAFPIPHLTAAQFLYSDLGLSLPSSPSTTKTLVLIWGGSTAVGHHAIQLAAQSGYKVFATGSKDAHDYLKTLGASEVFDYKDPQVVDKINEAAGKEGITLALDGVGENGTTDSIVAALSTTSSQNKVVSVLPPQLKNPVPSNTSVNFSLVYVLRGRALVFGGSMPFDVAPKERDFSLNYVSNELPKLLEGWKEGQGSPKLKGQKLRVLPGGLEGIQKGMRIMEKGEYGREKLVYSI